MQRMDAGVPCKLASGDLAPRSSANLGTAHAPVLTAYPPGLAGQVWWDGLCESVGACRVQVGHVGQDEPVWGCDAAAVEETHCIAFCAASFTHVSSCGRWLEYLHSLSS